MKAFAFLLAIGLVIAGCTQPPAGNGTQNNTTGNGGPGTGNATIPPGYEVKDYCRNDSDCVRLNKCCDCGMGEYVNKYNQKAECPPGEPQCMCPIQLSHGECVNDRCVAVADSVEEPGNATPPEEKVTLFSGHGECGNEAKPQREDNAWGTRLYGRIAAPNPCYFVSALVEKSSGAYTFKLTSKPTDAEVCVQCTGAIPWEINITGFSGDVEVQYDGRKVYPTTQSFCGWSTGGSCASDSDCVKGGCSGQVCQSKGEPSAITTCEWRDCYDSEAAGVSCGCVQGTCQWG
ncbi:MAG: eight-cysteine-cluster domain-containing protein [Candidatus Micrarchaeota archaeon]